ncbi:transketolase family protein [Culicoidibacter larvae]|uniref:Transketolase family protein n=1 Tax=Culicoidibacter larvae TaxID=2579976 RepID=A0A5R8QBP6_9FIRM|nr:transketolase C-terminal domain-containing protein [Culicoidibacter larvae]TLG73932.1 transketolase family protein [Culicoidibacter larvae]
MSNKVANRQVVCDVLVAAGQQNRDLVVLTSDSRGSASLAKFAEQLPEQLVEVGIAEQNLVSIAAGLAHSGKRSFVASPACFLSMRSIEQIKVDVAYSNTNVKLVGISGGVSYGALGMSHHSLQDIAVTRAIPNLQVLLPADRFETEAMFRALVVSNQPAYIRIGRNPVADCYESADYGFTIGKGVKLRAGTDITIIATGEMVRVALDTAELLAQINIACSVINIHTIKPLDIELIRSEAEATRRVISLEEHSIFGGLGAAIAEALSMTTNVIHKIIGIPDEPVVTGSSAEIFSHYGLDAQSVYEVAQEMVGGHDG